MIGLPLLIEITVTVLLFVTVGYCIILERRMKAFRAGQEGLRALVVELDTATRRAEQTVLGLGRTTREAEAALENQLREARALTRSLALLSAGAGKADGRSAARRPHSPRKLASEPDLAQGAARR